MAIREGRWDCSHCGARGIRGRYTACPECGAARGADVEFYLPEDEPEVTDPDRLEQASAGPDWHCEHCGADNAGTSPTCARCGAARGESEARAERFYRADASLPRTGADAAALLQAEETAAEAEARRRAGAGIAGVPETGYYQSPAEQSLRRLGSTLANPAVVGLAFFALLTWLVWFFLVSTHPVTFTVSGVRWQRSIAVEHYVTVTEEDWSVPPGGRTVDRAQKLHHYDKVFVRNETRTRQVSERVRTGTRTVREKVGTRSKGNGYFEDVYEERHEPVYETRYRTETYSEPVYRDVPVYRTSYRYLIERWKPARKALKSGADLHPAWPDPRLQRNERESGREATYHVTLTGPKGQRFERELPEERWNRCTPGLRVVGHVNRAGQVLRLEWP